MGVEQREKCIVFHTNNDDVAWSSSGCFCYLLFLSIISSTYSVVKISGVSNLNVTLLHFLILVLLNILLGMPSGAVFSIITF